MKNKVTLDIIDSSQDSDQSFSEKLRKVNNNYDKSDMGVSSPAASYGGAPVKMDTKDFD